MRPRGKPKIQTTTTLTFYSCIPFAGEGVSGLAQASSVNKRAPEFPSVGPFTAGLHQGFAKRRGVTIWVAEVLVVVLLPIWFSNALPIIIQIRLTAGIISRALDAVWPAANAQAPQRLPGAPRPPEAPPEGPPGPQAPQATQTPPEPPPQKWQVHVPCANEDAKKITGH